MLRLRLLQFSGGGRETLAGGGDRLFQFLEFAFLTGAGRLRRLLCLGALDGRLDGIFPALGARAAGPFLRGLLAGGALRLFFRLGLLQPLLARFKADAGMLRLLVFLALVAEKSSPTLASP